MSEFFPPGFARSLRRDHQRAIEALARAKKERAKVDGFWNRWILTKEQRDTLRASFDKSIASMEHTCEAYVEMIRTQDATERHFSSKTPT